ncbi:hypothetical protein Hypma_007046 [Hypsizygus marmoreus]|uniref:Uncharacterized protein n=1 Tax=Hypsizygus marmoreus TaxID=39966 RepID=A0A369KHB4_HYPMA|nr:hypothetical protein Hypma_007046 [Hypsizygus marmoreus]
MHHVDATTVCTPVNSFGNDTILDLAQLQLWARLPHLCRIPVFFLGNECAIRARTTAHLRSLAMPQPLPRQPPTSHPLEPLANSNTH